MAARRRRTARKDVFTRRRERLARGLRRRKMDSLLISSVNNVRYLSGFSGDDSFLLLTRYRSILITDGRYATQAAEEMDGVDVRVRKGGIIAESARLARRLGLRRLGFEARAMLVAQYSLLTRELGGKCEAVATEGVVEALRECKSREEVKAIRRAIAVAEAAIGEVAPKIRVGVSERALAAELDAAMRRLGADGPAFQTICAAGKRAALPHAHPTDRKIAEGEPVLFDWGARLDLYNSDLTRVFFVSRIPARWRRLYEAVLEAQLRAIRAVRAGRTTGEVDAAARRSLRKRRCARYFSHGLGHGVGLDVHEAPALRDGGSKPLASGMVVTVEPGVYLPGIGGIRIEDMVLVQPQGCRVLTDVPKSIETIVVANHAAR